MEERPVVLAHVKVKKNRDHDTYSHYREGTQRGKTLTGDSELGESDISKKDLLLKNKEKFMWEGKVGDNVGRGREETRER